MPWGSPTQRQHKHLQPRRGPSAQMVWDQLKTVYDPEIPVNIVDLGLVYSCVIAPLEQGGNRLHIKMSMTAPGCGMGNVLKADVDSRLRGCPVSRKFMLKSCSIRHGIRPLSNAAKLPAWLRPGLRHNTSRATDL